MEQAQVWLRWAQFIDLALVFGAPLTAWLSGERRMGGRWPLALAAGCVAGLVLGVAGFLVTLCAMMGGGIGDLDSATLMMMACHSALGWSVIVRLGALLIGLGLALSARTGALVPVGAAAVASLAWGGHAAASQGGAGMLRLGGDIVHLWCGLTWLGALVLFTAGLWRVAADDRGGVAGLVRALGGFAMIGTVLVGGLTLTGLANLLFLMPVAQWWQMPETPYGRLILAKLMLFAMMFVLAAHHRFHLVPALEQAATRDARRRALLALRRSVSLETALAVGVVWCVAFAGTLDPSGSM